jgi:hypothetical protein
MKRLSVKLGLVALATVALATGPTGAASAQPAPADPGVQAAPCWRASNRWWCNNVYGADVYALVYDGTHWWVGDMWTTTSWFDCRSDDGPWVGGPNPWRWVFTQADNGEWGWMKDTAIYSDTDTLPVCLPTVMMSR